MSNLNEICSRLDQQFFDQQHIAIPVESQAEAVQEALAEINAFLSKNFTIEGLDGALIGTLPEDHEAVLVFGAAAFALDFSLRNQLIRFNAMEGKEDTLRLWCEHLRRQFEAGLERLRLFALQSESALPYSAWAWDEPNHWSSL